MEAEMGLKINFPDHIMGGFGADGFWPSGTTPLSWMTPLKDTGSWEGESRLGVSRKSVAKSGNVWPQIARLTDHPQKWACTFWNLLALRIPKSTGSFLWDVCEPSNSRLKLIDFSEIYRKYEIHENGKMSNWWNFLNRSHAGNFYSWRLIFCIQPRIICMF